MSQTQSKVGFALSVLCYLFAILLNDLHDNVYFAPLGREDFAKPALGKVRLLHLNLFVGNFKQAGTLLDQFQQCPIDNRC